VGAGPGGSVAAKACATAGLETILLEKKRLPRDKVCSGMLLGCWARKLVQQEFGNIPVDVLVEPYKGMGFHLGGGRSTEMEVHIPVGWRKDLDYWMCSKASQTGARLRDTAKVTGIRRTPVSTRSMSGARARKRIISMEVRNRCGRGIFHDKEIPLARHPCSLPARDEGVLQGGTLDQKGLFPLVLSRRHCHSAIRY